MVMEESEPQVPAQVGAQVPAQVGNEATRFKKGRSGRYVPIEEHRAVLARLAELEGSEELAAKDAELAELRERLAAGEARNRVKVLEGENGELRARVAELEAAARFEESDEGSARAEALIRKILGEDE